MVESGNGIRAELSRGAVAVEYGDGFAAEPAYVHDCRSTRPTTAVARPIAEPLVGDSRGSPPSGGEAARQRSQRRRGCVLAAAIVIVGDRATITHSSSFGLLEISAPGMTKATGWPSSAESHGIVPHEVLAIGDMPNDVPMLQWPVARTPWRNAHPAVVEVADEVIGSKHRGEDDDAVAN